MDDYAGPCLLKSLYFVLFQQLSLIQSVNYFGHISLNIRHLF